MGGVATAMGAGGDTIGSPDLYMDVHQMFGRVRGYYPTYRAPYFNRTSWGYYGAYIGKLNMFRVLLIILLTYMQ